MRKNLISRCFHIIFPLITLLTFESFGQVGANFSVTSGEGCNAFTVTVNDFSGAPETTAVTYDYGDGEGEVTDTFHTYTSPGIYEIVQIVADGTPRTDTIVVEVVDPQEPQFILSNCKGTEASIYITDTLYNAHWVDWGDGATTTALSGEIITHDYGALGSFDVSVKGLMDEDLSENDLANLNCASRTKTLQLTGDIEVGEITRVEVLNDSAIRLSYDIGGGTAYLIEVSENGSSSFSSVGVISDADYPSGYTLSNLNTAENFYCFRLMAVDFCDPGDQRSSGIACSVNLRVNPENNQNQLNWTTETLDLSNYEVFKDGSPLTSVTVNNYADTSVECGIAYCYRVVMHENGGLESVSNIRCDTAFSNDTPAAIANVSASVEGNGVVLNWNEVQPPPEYFEIRKIENENTFPPIQTATNTFTDSAAVPESNRYFYEISYENKCGKQSQPAVASPVLLSRSADFSIQWTGYVGWQNDPQYYLLEKYSVDGELIETTDMGQEKAFTETDFDNLPQQVIYRIVAMPSDAGLPQVNSNFLTLTFPSIVVFPNAFTPNGDGLNDFFNFEGKYVTEYRLTIFTRWGELIFETDNIDTGWNGTFKAKPVPSGMYIFKAEFVDEMGVQFSKKGEIYLIR